MFDNLSRGWCWFEALPLLGSSEAVERATADCCVAAVLTDGNPSCGTTCVYDGSFTGDTVAGMGVAARLIADHGVRVFTEDQIEQADEYLRSLRDSPERGASDLSRRMAGPTS